MERTNPLRRSAIATCRRFRALAWIAQIAVAGILGQTLFFKFAWAPETQFIFGQLGGRPAATLVGLIELAAVVLLLVPRASAFGAIVSLAVTGGAIVTHLTIIGIEIVDPVTGQGDGGLLFGLGIVVAVLSCGILAIRHHELQRAIDRLAQRSDVGQTAGFSTTLPPFRAE